MRRRSRSGSRQHGVRRARRPASSAVTTTARSSSGAALEPARGPIVDEAGNEIGRHDGHWRFTPGQRRGLGVASAEPLYTISTIARSNAVVAGPAASLACRKVRARGRLYVKVDRVEAKLRYRSPGVPARVSVFERGFELDLEEPAFAVAPGQTAVLYEGDVVVGAGVVSTATRVLAA